MCKSLLSSFTALFVFATNTIAAHSLEPLRLPPGFKATIYADNIEDARSLALGPGGTVYVGTRQAGKVYALINRQRGERADEVVTIASGLESPNGISLHNGALYVAEHSRVVRFPDIAKHLRDKPKPEVVYDKLPTEFGHGWRYAKFGPDDKLYVAVGAPCNICKPDPDRHAVILRMNADGSGVEPYARGIRNSVGFDWQPQTKSLWFTDNGRDWLGDNQPPDELNNAPKAGMHFGYPYCHGGDIADPEFGKEKPCSEFTPPAVKLAPHTASLGLRFYTGDKFPARYRNGIFIAEHGSWNRSEPMGYRIMFVPFENGKPAGYEVFAEGWLQGGRNPWGRPVDVLVMPDGALLVSDDRAGAVYRIAYIGK